MKTRLQTGGSSGSGTRAVVLVVVAAAAFLLAACSSDGSGDATPSESVVVVGTAAPAPEAETAAPDFQIEAFGTDDHTAGEVIRLSDYVGRPVVLNFWYPSCPPCRLEMPDLEATYQKHKADGVEFIGVQLLGLDSIQDGQEFIDEFDVNYAVGPDSDSKIIIDFKVRGFPTTIFLDRNQEIVRSWTGALTGEKLEEFVLELLE